MVKKIVILAILTAIVIAILSGAGLSSAASPQKIGIVQIVEHPALDLARQGFIDKLQEQGIDQSVFRYRNAQGDFATASAICQQFVSERVDLILAIATPSAQAAAHATSTIPIVFTAVTDPKTAGLVESFARPGGNATGTSDMAPVGEQLALLLEIVPTVQRVGVLYNPGEANSVVQVELAEQAAKNLGLTLIKAGVSSSADVYQAAQSLVGRVDAFYVPTDNTVVSAIDSVIMVSYDAKIPIIAGEDNQVKAGGLATLGINYYVTGRQAGQIALRILNGEDPAEIPVGTQKELDLVVNLAAAAQLGIEIPEEVLAKADVIVE